MQGVAFKVTYNDGGAGAGRVGFRGICSRGNIAENAQDGGPVWCSQSDNPCRIFADGNFRGPRPRIVGQNGPCYEATLLSHKPFRFGAGIYHNGERAGQPIPISQLKVGDIAFLTTIPPGGSQQDRFVFALFRVGRLYAHPTWGNMVESDGSMDVILADDVAEDTLYWDFQKHNDDGSTLWNSGLFRYLSTERTTALLNDVLLRLEGHDERDDIVRALGPLVTPYARGGSLGLGGGEGEAHRTLKLRVAADPTLVGLPKDSLARVEYVYRYTGDRVDICFELPDGSAAVVEIETICPLPGAHQCIKYRALLQAERGEALGEPGVDAILVAYDFDLATRTFAGEYGIRLVELGP